MIVDGTRELRVRVSRMCENGGRDMSTVVRVLELCRHLGGELLGVEFVWAMVLADGVDGLVRGEPYCADMSSESMSEASAASTRTSASGWGMGDPGVSMTSMHLRVLGGHLVWSLAFHQLVTARDRCAFMEQCLEGSNFLLCR